MDRFAVDCGDSPKSGGLHAGLRSDQSQHADPSALAGTEEIQLHDVASGLRLRLPDGARFRRRGPRDLLYGSQMNWFRVSAFNSKTFESLRASAGGGLFRRGPGRVERST